MAIRETTKDKISRNEIKKLKQSFQSLKKSGAISVLYPVCGEIDVHKESLVACLFYQDEASNQKAEVRTFSTFTDDIYRLKEWLLSADCPVIAIESTGVYWRPVHNVLEDSIKVVLVNARHFKNVPGRKTDVSDSRWLCTLLQYGLLRGSFIPEAQIRQWRKLNRLRRQISKSAADYKRRVHKVFETANIKIDSVVSDLFGVTGRNLINYLCQCERPTLADVTQCARGSLREKVHELHRSIQGFFNEHHRLEIQSLMRIITLLEEEARNLSSRLHSQIMEEHSNLIRNYSPHCTVIPAKAGI